MMFLNRETAAALLWIAMIPTVVAQQQKDRLALEEVVVRVASISFVPEKFNLQGNADRLEQAMRRAKKGGAQIAVAPEGSLDGYVVNQIISGEASAERMNEVAIPIDHAVVQRFQGLARELQISMVFGLAERVGDDVFNCAVFIDHEGRICGKYHKMQFAEGYHSSWWFNRLGQNSRAFDTPHGRCGMMICNDRWNPQLAKIPVLDGARFLIIPAYGSRSRSQDQAVLDRGRENDIPVVEANVGVSLVVDGGEIIAVDRREEGITFANITIPAAVNAKPDQRDQVEQAFLTDRAQEMERRYEKTIHRRNEDKAGQSMDCVCSL
jgi:predicted amidohydrolase